MGGGFLTWIAVLKNSLLFVMNDNIKEKGVYLEVLNKIKILLTNIDTSPT